MRKNAQCGLTGGVPDFREQSARARARETFRKPPSRLYAQGVEADCEARGKLKNVKARGRFAGHSIAPVAVSYTHLTLPTNSLV